MPSIMEEKSPTGLERTYERFREHIRSENDLYNRRIIWLITMQAFLFATAALMLQTHWDDNSSDSETLRVVFEVVIALTGILVGLVASRILRDAMDTINELDGDWKTIRDKEADPDDDCKLFPPIKGRNDTDDGRFAKLTKAHQLPHIFILVWIVMAVLFFIEYWGVFLQCQAKLADGCVTVHKAPPINRRKPCSN